MENNMHKAIYLLKDIPKGKVVSYKELARASGTSPRAVGRIVAGNEYPHEYPCYKVVAVDGCLTGYSGPGGIDKKRELLGRDGIDLVEGRVPGDRFHLFDIT